MNLLELLDNELDGKHYNNFEKIRYIYLKTCELFYFDSRYYYIEKFNKKLFNKIINKKIDITNIDDFSVICHSYSKYVLYRLINELTNADVVLQTGSHSYLDYKDDSGSNWILDATLGDLSRIKVGIKSNGFTCRESWFLDYQEFLDEVDDSIGYKFKERKDFMEYLNQNSFEDLINSVNELINESELNNFTDVLFFLKWLLQSSFYSFSDCTGMDKDCNFYNFIYDETNNDLFCLSKENDKYGINSISFDEGLQLSKKLNMNSKSFFNNR